MSTKQSAIGTAVPYPDEVVHLQDIQAKLQESLDSADQSVDSLDADYRDAKQYMVEHRGDIDPHEMFQSSQLLRQIDRSGAFAVEVKSRLEKLVESPYFARIDFQADDHTMPSIYYIGRFAFAHENQLMILDWRAPIASIFYDYELGPASYAAPQGQISGTLTRKRQFKIKSGMMEYALETSLNVQDDVLQRELSLSADEKMKSIIATIQREQNAIIRNERAKTLIIQGVAGSGKTSIALHRVAFLLYRFSGRLSAQNITIISPNKVFGDYISGVLPELGEEPIFSVSLEDIAGVQLEGVIGFEPDKTPSASGEERASFKSTAAFVRQMDAFIADIPCITFNAQPYRHERFAVTAEWIKSRLAAYSRYPLFKRLEMIADDIHERFQTDNYMEEELPRPRTILKSLKGMLTVKNTLALYKTFYRQIDRPEMLVMPNRKTLEWSDVFPFLYLRATFEGLQSSGVIRHLVVDEMQDYTPIQFAVLNRLFPCEKTILGDFGQAIHPCYRHTLDDLRQQFVDAEFVSMKKSYRSTKEIIEFAKRICPDAEINAIDRHGPEPLVIACSDASEESILLRQMVGLFGESDYTTLGIIVKTDDGARAIYDALAPYLAASLITPESDRFAHGVTITSIPMAKGLEFDEVIIPDTDSTTYATKHDRSLLYVACTRAMHKLTLLHAGEQTPLIR